MNHYFSLIMPTLGRNKELDVFCAGLAAQTFKDFELIVVDQNIDDRAAKALERYKSAFTIVYIKSGQKGLSYNRNIGLKSATGIIIAFPDDDCEYKSDTLAFVRDFFRNNDYDFLTFNYEDKKTNECYFPVKRRVITWKNLYSSAISFTIFAKNDLFRNRCFDTRLGVGARFGAGEETDMLAAFLKDGTRGFYDGTYTVYHAIQKQMNSALDEQKRAYNYALGFGALHRKIGLYYKQRRFLFAFVCAVLKNIAAIVISPKRKLYVTALKGKLRGFMEYRCD